MKSKWYLSTLVVILSLLGFSQPQVYFPNQEIVVQFSDDEVTFDEAQNAVALVKEQLQTIGVDNIQVRESVDGRLKITYYSDVDVTIIAEIFSKEKNLDLGYSSYPTNKEGGEFPSQENSKIYELDVFEIQNNSDFDSGFSGYLVELELKSNRFFTPTVFFFAHKNEVEERNRVEKTAYVIQKNIAIAIDTVKHSIPEVRAGPFS